MYHNGNGVLKDSAEALKWFRKSAEQGNAFAQFKLGVMYGKGNGVQQDYAEASNISLYFAIDFEHVCAHSAMATNVPFFLETFRKNLL